MKKILASTVLFVILTSYKNNSIISPTNTSKVSNYASTALTIYNATQSSTVYSVTIELTNLPGGTYTYFTNIPPGTSSPVQLVGLANISQYVTLTLSLSNNTSGALRDWRYAPLDDIYYEMACQNFSHTTAPSLYFYLYSYNHLHLYPDQRC